MLRHICSGVQGPPPLRRRLVLLPPPPCGPLWGGACGALLPPPPLWALWVGACGVAKNNKCAAVLSHADATPQLHCLRNKAMKSIENSLKFVAFSTPMLASAGAIDLKFVILPLAPTLGMVGLLLQPRLVATMAPCNLGPCKPALGVQSSIGCAF